MAVDCKKLQLAQALQTIKDKKWIDLTHIFGATSPHFNAFPSLEKTLLFTHDDGFLAQNFSFAGQYGTHLDAPVHFVRNTRHVEDLKLKELVLPLVVVNIVDQVEEDDEYTITLDDIVFFEQQHGLIEAGSFVALRTDWSKRWPNRDAFNNKDDTGRNHAPGWSVDVLKFLFEKRHISAIGHETFDTDSSKEYAKNGQLLAEYYVLDQDTYQIELLTNLHELPAKGAIIFNIVAKPEEASGFPVRSFAVLPDNE
ncbi:cyclase family protein [Kurthia sibirica]|uniref:Cyclase n=1 Tax=Kurthia sibirica TaxID=202750 RepID=A0A2U3AN36_9BACL|nr:cyclase family protein [Kurthia sibirica]PWI25942.1 cyclase [Kurthia sibirica]GEK35146.1 metal-dependent hydrolase [Kurthia sibirica]